MIFLFLNSIDNLTLDATNIYPALEIRYMFIIYIAISWFGLQVRVMLQLSFGRERLASILFLGTQVSISLFIKNGFLDSSKVCYFLCQ